MIIQINQDYRLKTIPLNLVLEQRYTRKNRDTGAETDDWRPLGYHSGIKSALKALPDSLMHEEAVADLQALVDRVDQVVGEAVRRISR